MTSVPIEFSLSAQEFLSIAIYEVTSSLEKMQAASTAGFNQVVAGLNKSTGAAQQLHAQTQTTSTGVKQLFQAFTGGNLALSALNEVKQQLADVYDKAVAWDQQLQQIQANTGMTDAAIRQMDTGIRDMGSGTAANLNQLAQGLKQAADFGNSAADSQKIVNAAQMESVATGGNAAQAAGQLAATLHVYNLEGDQAIKVANTFMLASQRGNETMQQFAASSQKAFAVGAELHIPLEQVAAALSSLTRNGFDAAQAQTQLINIMTRQINPTKQAHDELVRLSQVSGKDLVSAFTAQGVAQNGLAGNMDLLQQAYQATGLSQTDATAETLKLMGAQRGGLGEAALLGKGYTDFNTNLKDMSATMSGTATPVQDNYAKAMEKTAGKTEMLSNKIDLLKIKLGELATATAGNPIMDFLNTGVGNLNMLTGATSMPGAGALADLAVAGHQALQDAELGTTNAANSTAVAFRDEERAGEATAATLANVAAASAGATPNLLELAKAAQANAKAWQEAQLDTAQTQLQALQASQKQAAYDQQQALDSVRDKETAVREAVQQTDAAYQARVDTLRAENTQLDRNYQAQQQARSIARLSDKIEDERAMAGDLYSSAGASARAALRTDQARLQDEQGRQTLDATKASNDRKISAIEAERKASDEVARRTEQSLQASARQITEDGQRRTFQVSQAEAAIRDNIAHLRDTTTAQQAYAAAIQTAGAQVTGSFFGLVNTVKGFMGAIGLSTAGLPNIGGGMGLPPGMAVPPILAGLLGRGGAPAGVGATVGGAGALHIPTVQVNVSGLNDRAAGQQIADTLVNNLLSRLPGRW